MLLACAVNGAAAEGEKIKITFGLTPVVPVASTYLALDKGYLAEAGFDVAIENQVSAANFIPFLSTNRVQVVQGGITVGYYNAVAQGLPIVLALDSGSSPVNQDLLVRPELRDRIKAIADLKGRTVGVVVPGSMPHYFVGKALETAGLTIKDVEVKFIAFPAMGPALKNGALDAALEVPPYGDQLVAQGIGARWINPDEIVKPRPVAVVAYFVNTDWAAQNRAAALKLFTALARAGREYCDAYHHAANRAEVVDTLARHGVMADRELLARMAWQARDPNGHFNRASLDDIQTWFFRQGLMAKKAPDDKLVDDGFAEAAAKSLGPYTPANPASPLEGCR
jgi:NitT/TauT family transport system substrate-binding protein